MSLCPTACANFELVSIKEEACTIEERKKTIRALGMYKCDVQIPQPITEENLTALITAGSLVFSNELVNVQVGEPTYEERKISDCRPATEVLTEREITFEDRIKVETVDNKFLDYDFWQDKIDHSAQLNYMFVMCNGDLVVPIDDNGYGLSASFRMHLNQEALQRSGSVELKAGRLLFQGDPLSMKYKPVANLNDFASLAGKW